MRPEKNPFKMTQHCFVMVDSILLENRPSTVPTTVKHRLPAKHAFVEEMLRGVVRRKEGGVKLSQKIQEVEGLTLSPVANIAKTDRPEVAVITEKRKERT